MSPVHLRNVGILRNQSEDRQGLFRTRRPGSGHHGSHNRWQETEGDHTHTAIYPPIQLEPQTRGLEGYGSCSSASQIPQRFIPMENGQQELQPIIKMGRTCKRFSENISHRDTLQRSYGNHQKMESQQEVQTPGGEGNQEKGKSSHYPSHRRRTEPETAYSYSFILTRIKPTRLPSSLTPFRQKQLNDQNSP
ncbi:hypothetical protein O181_032102 [Austropuccinia psidii MF-1]|uniref:Uncharacterized protein n=1 Tax=Austropuccinia psidii MF-1 TaxID=1389203 RepID=A0A9Q3H5Z0_9BASI|nr:hypothetical protein [Austropuccinia psidii MF-1]